MNLKKRTTLYLTADLEKREKAILKEKKKLYIFIARKYFKEHDYTNAILYARMVYEIDKTDTNVIRKLSNLYFKVGDYTNYISIKREWDSYKNNAWSKLGLVCALESVYKKTNTTAYVEEAISLTELLLNTNSITQEQTYYIALKLAKLYRKTGDYGASKSLYVMYLKSDKLNPEKMQQMALGYIITTAKSGNKTKAIRLSKLILKQQYNISDSDEEIIQQLATNMKPTTSLMFEYTLYKLFKSEGKIAQQHKTINRILAIDSNDKFAAKVQTNM